MRSQPTAASLALLLTVACPAQAAVIDAGSGGFTVRHALTIDAPRDEVYRIAVEEVGKWWSSDHTVSKDAANLRIDTGVPGCFCETLGGDAGLVHLFVTFVNPGVMLRFTGGLGPLGLMGVNGNMTWEFEDRDDGTAVTLHYALGGYRPGGLDSMAEPVDAVLVEQMERLKHYVEQDAESR
ncbi:MAG: SRPBCC family protein [Woeseiaceae bacterium]